MGAFIVSGVTVNTEGFKRKLSAILSADVVGVEEMVSRNNMENSECILCGMCVDNCEQGAIAYFFNSK